MIPDQTVDPHRGVQTGIPTGAAPVRGRLFLVVGPSGVGKDTLLAGAVLADPRLHWARRLITRPESAGAEPFEGVTEAVFRTRLLGGDLALHWRAHGLSYGVTRAELAPTGQGRDVLLNGSRGAIAQALASFPDLKILHITAPLPVLAQRLADRGREALPEVQARLARATLALPADLPANLSVTRIVNDASPELGVARLLQALRA